MQYTVTFDQVKQKGFKKFKCSCGKTVTRQQTFSQTLNPYNKNKQGFPKSRGEILAELDKEIELWKNDLPPYKKEECTHSC